jgi:hypothetical protein
MVGGCGQQVLSKSGSEREFASDDCTKQMPSHRDHITVSVEK